MKNSVIFFLLALASVYCSALPEDTRYTTKYDNVDIEEILKSDRLLKNYMNCLLDKGRCTPDAQELKNNLPDGLENGCSKCSPKQKEIGRKVLKFLIEEKRPYFDQLEAKYDPNGKYRARYDADLKKEGIQL
ncbi:ejaculatory bulb-specific protein 3-like isoform X1 [Euwallacea similis]|uniref:ejaculatory bulb-specific protein 3-like isoform X1 n=1 Tax=Euwallacea similis TaxID=1736056 RepID=UPI00344C4EEE